MGGVFPSPFVVRTTLDHPVWLFGLRRGLTLQYLLSRHRLFSSSSSIRIPFPSSLDDSEHFGFRTPRRGSPLLSSVRLRLASASSPRACPLTFPSAFLPTALGCSQLSAHQPARTATSGLSCLTSRGSEREEKNHVHREATEPLVRAVNAFVKKDTSA